MNRIFSMTSVVLALGLLVGCATLLSAMISGGTAVPGDFQVEEVLVRYRPVGQYPAHAQYLLVRTDRGLAMFEREKDGSGALFETHWTDEEGDHFAAWLGRRIAWVFVVPRDRTKPAKRYVYQYKRFSFSSPFSISGNRVIPKDPRNKEPVTMLFPKE